MNYPHRHTKSPTKEKCITRQSIIDRAEEWVEKKVLTNHCGRYQNYRMDCSGFVGYALQLPAPGPTSSSLGREGKFLKEINKTALQPGDVMVCPHYLAAGKLLSNIIVVFFQEKRMNED